MNIWMPLIAALLATTPTFASGDGMEVVNCWDAERGIVQPVRRKRCTGREVTSPEATRLKAEYDRNRRLTLARGNAIRRAEAARPVRFYSAGAGFAIDANGTILTSAHVVRPCDAVELRIPNSPRRLPVRIRAMDDGTDLALLDTSYRTRHYLRLAPHLPTGGEPVAVIGYPLEGRIRLTPRLTPAIVDYDLSDPRKRGLIGVMGDVRRGHSGGPVLDSKGRVIGVLKAKIDSVEASRLTGKILKHLAVVTEARAVAAFLERAKTRHAIDGTRGRERTERELYAIGTAATVRLDCLKRG